MKFADLDCLLLSCASDHIQFASFTRWLCHIDSRLPLISRWCSLVVRVSCVLWWGTHLSLKLLNVAIMCLLTTVCIPVSLLAPTVGCELLSTRYSPWSLFSSYLISTGCWSSRYDEINGKASPFWWICETPISSSIDLCEISSSVSCRISISKGLFTKEVLLIPSWWQI